MFQINQQFAIRYLIPLIQDRILKDMKEGKKNTYLHKLQIGEVLNPVEKKDFFDDYFPIGSEIGKLFLGDQTGFFEFREQFLKHFSKFLKNKIYLSGQEGVAKAYFVKEDKSNSSEVQLNIFRLAYYMSLEFERERTEKLIEKTAAKNSEALEPENYRQKYLKLLKEGKLKLVKLPDGTEQFYSEEQLKQLAGRNPDIQVIPYIESGLGERLLGINGAQISVPISESFGAGLYREVAPAGLAGAESDPYKEVPASFSNLEKDFASSQIGRVEMDLQENGLELINGLKPIELDENGNLAKPDSKNKKTVFQGKVKDVNGQELIVIVDPSKAYDSPEKIAFIFAGDPNQKNKYFKSQQDLKDFKEDDKPDGTPGRRKSAFEVLQPKASGLIVETKPVILPTEKSKQTSESPIFELPEVTAAPGISRTTKKVETPEKIAISRPLIKSDARISRKDETVLEAKQRVASQRGFDMKAPEKPNVAPGIPMKMPAQTPTPAADQQPAKKSKKGVVVGLLTGGAVGVGVGSAWLGTLFK